MNALIIALIASVCAALANLFFRKSAVSAKGTDNSSSYLLCFYWVTFIFALLLNPSIWTAPWNFTMIGIGVCVGLFNIALMNLTSRALKKGPAGLTFAFQNASAIFPGIILFLIFGQEFNFTYSYGQFLGMVLVVLGLFLGTKSSSGSTENPVTIRWMKYAISCLFVQVVALTLIQGRCVLFDCEKTGSILSPFSLTYADDVWFMPAQFGTAALIQTMIVLASRKEERSFTILYGSLGGIANCAASFLLLLATKWALPLEKAILIPCFAVGTIIVCNLWAWLIYKEKFNIPSSTTCALGVLMGSFV